VSGILPSWVTKDNVIIDGKEMAQFHEIDDRQVANDTLVSVQAMHERFHAGAHSKESTGSIDINTAC
jgi:hypothetical protein